MFRCISHHLQEEFTYSLRNTICFHTAIVYDTLVASQNKKATTLFVYNIFSVVKII